MATEARKISEAVLGLVDEIRSSKALQQAAAGELRQRSRLFVLMTEDRRFFDSTQESGRRLLNVLGVSGAGDEKLLARMASPDLADRITALGDLFEQAEKALFSRGNRDLPELIADAVKSIGPRALFLEPQIEHLYRQFLVRKQKNNPGFTLPFEEWLRKHHRNRKRLRTILSALLAEADLRRAFPRMDEFDPSVGACFVDPDRAKALFKLLCGPDTISTLFRKTAGFLPRERRIELLRALRDGTLTPDLPMSAGKRFYQADLSTLQGNAAEISARSKRFEYLEAMKPGDENQKQLYMFSGIRFSGRRNVDLDVPAGDIRYSRDSMPAREAEVTSIEFTDGLIAHLPGESKAEFRQIHEIKMTRNSLDDLIEQAENNREAIEFCSRITIDEVHEIRNRARYRLNDDDLKELAREKGFKLEKFKEESLDANGELVTKDRLRLVIEEESKLDEKLAKAEKLFRAREKQILERHGGFTDVAIAERKKALDELYDSLNTGRRITGFTSAKKVLFAPRNQADKAEWNHLLGQPLPVEFDQEIDALEFTYEEFRGSGRIALANGPFVRN